MKSPSVLPRHVRSRVFATLRSNAGGHAHVGLILVWLAVVSLFHPACDPNELTGDGEGETEDESDKDCSEDDAESFEVYPDMDGDGFGDASASPKMVCTVPTGFVRNPDDCDDSETTVHGGAEEVCNFVDDDCDGDVDEGVEPFAVFTDRDDDGYGAADASAVYVCMDHPGYARNIGDCNDAEPTVHPGVVSDICNFVDDDCDGDMDEDGQPFAVYTDDDDDGYGDVNASAIYVCIDHPGYARNNDDCNDSEPTIHPGVASDICNFVDDDCDGSTDEDGPPFAVYTDDDDDGFGDADASGIYVCIDHPGYARNNGDCNDTEPSINPGVASDICNFVDDDCDGSTDEDSPPFAVYTDDDDDGFGDTNASGIYVCIDHPGYARNNGDCNDTEPTINPGVASDICNFVDDDCDGSTDEDESPFAIYTDDDDDGYGDANASGIYVCLEHPGYARNKTDCNDASATVNPGATELCHNGIDDDCDGHTDSQALECAQSQYCGDLTVDTIWAAGDTHVVTCMLNIKNSATLTIKDGAVVHFEPGAGLTVARTSAGKLIVDGHSDGVRFTSAEDTPAPGDWTGLLLGDNDSGSQLTGLTIEYGGGEESSCLAATKMPSPLMLRNATVTDCSGRAALVVNDSDINFRNVVVQDNANNGIHIFGKGEVEGWNEVSSTGNGESAMVVSLETLTDILAGSGTYTGNGDDRIHVSGGVIAESVDWPSPGVPLVIGAVIDVSGGDEIASLTIEDGMTLQFEEAGEIKVGHSGPGALNIYAFKGVRLTSARPKPSAGDWPGITFGTGESGSLLKGVTIEYGGGNGFGNLTFEYADSGTLISDCTIQYSSSYGIYRDGVSPDLMDNEFVSNAAGDVF